ncbi:MAG: GGDEF domain-containing protein [Xanthomonadales bacterium]|nr:hypothetical protein [Xanthomonadales bacterium]MCC6594135.1 GGDEF domain-containing protein [Xanthomonadales bacterium]MCE7931343.1 GGDEF domain-containing protein [Xanthomonadales bacterium PRO6]
MSAKLLSLLQANAAGLWLAALLLALGFRRNRYALVLMALGVPLLQERAESAVLLGSAALAAVASLLPEPPLRSLRALFLLTLALSLPWWPERASAFTGWLAQAAQWRSPEPLALPAAAWLSLVAAASALLRWLRQGWPLDLYLALALIPATCGFAVATPGDAVAWLAAAAAAIGIGVLYGAYSMAFIDALTGLPNRRALDERLARSHGRIAVAMVDVDHFKRFNDRHGHETGDRVLRAVARQLRRCAGGDAYRYGGEEFAIVFEGRAVERASESLERVREQVEAQRVRLKAGGGRRAQAVRRGQAEGEVGVTVSIGMAERDPERRTSAAVVDAADKALYRSKQRGRNRLTLAGAARAA